MPLRTFDIYTVSATTHPIIGVKFRGRVRKFAIEHQMNILVENATDQDEAVRFAVPAGTETESLEIYMRSLVPGVQINSELESVCNPVLSKLKVNDTSRY